MGLAMWNLRDARRQRRLLLLSTVLLAIGAGVLFAAVRADADSVGTLQVHGTFRINFVGVACPAGSPAMTGCYSQVSASDAAVPGLGRMTTAYTLVYEDFGSGGPRCHVHAQIPIVIAGKGEIDLATRSTSCITPTLNTANPTPEVPPTEYTITGGSGRYAGASGSGALDYVNRETSPGAGYNNITWTGTLNVAGLSFDTTPPQITGATPKAAKTRTAKGARVRYSVSATDATDGPVPVACLPKSGSVFRVGRKTVTCTAADGSSNIATARFVITVKRTHR
jgi:hypothetical protein